jgi:putative hemolysin
MPTSSVYMSDTATDNNKNFLDLEKVIAGKNPGLLKAIPGFIIRYLKRIIHQEDLNAIIYRHRDKFGLEFLDSVLKDFGVKITYDGLENVPATGRWIVAANHPLGGMDGMALMWVCGKVRQDIVFPVNDLLMHIDNLRQLFIPVNKHGSNAGNARIIDETFASDKAMLYFPAGLCSRRNKDGICDLNWKKSFVTKAKQHQRMVIPCYIKGRNSNWFYNLARWRTRLGVKTNIEMLYLVDEMFKQRDKEISITFGKPISFSIFDKTKSDSAWANELKNHVYSLASHPEKEF